MYQPGGDRKRQRKSRWADDDDSKVVIPGMPTALPDNLTPEQEKLYLLQLQIEELTRRLRSGDFQIPPNPEDRSPSPEPVYNMEGKRLNTREYRARKKLEEERHNLIQKMLNDNPNYKPPTDYKAPQIKMSEKVQIPQEEYPDINFVGLIIGPRGNTLKKIESECGAKIIIRGKGSVKEGKVGRKDGQPMPGEDEPLHAFVTGTTQEQVKKAVSRIKEIVRQGVEVPENQNDLRRTQLRELAQLNGTLRESDSFRCSNCGSETHKNWQCPEKQNITNNINCLNCGGYGHLSRDCKEPKRSSTSTSKIDEEYKSFMAELSSDKPKSDGSSNYNKQNGSNQSSMLRHDAMDSKSRSHDTPNPNNTYESQRSSSNYGHNERGNELNPNREYSSDSQQKRNRDLTAHLHKPVARDLQAHHMPPPPHLPHLMGHPPLGPLSMPIPPISYPSMLPGMPHIPIIPSMHMPMPVPSGTLPNSMIPHDLYNLAMAPPPPPPPQPPEEEV